MPLRRRLVLLLLALPLALAAGGTVAAPASDPAAFISNLAAVALQALNDKQMTQQQREQRFHSILDDNFDVPRISRFVLGRYWNGASDAERQQFNTLFDQYIVRTYSQRFSQYSGETLKVTGSRPESETSTIVQSEILRPSGAPPAKVDWRVRAQKGDYRIVDVDIEGVSMALTLRQEFAAVIQRNGSNVAGLNKVLEQKLASGHIDEAPGLPTDRR